MRKNGIRIMAVLLLAGLLLICGTASANSWNLKGRLYRAVEQSREWIDYTALSSQADSFAVMKARYHHALFYADAQERLHVYTAAVYQPEDGRETPSLYLDGQDLHLDYGKQEKYVFRAFGKDGEYQLYSAEIGGFRLEGNAESGDGVTFYRAAEGDGTAFWPAVISLADFNIRLLPHSVEEVRAMNLMRAQFDSSLQCLGTADLNGSDYSVDRQGKLLQPREERTAAVYSAPYGESAWRAGNGKAAAGLNDSIWLLCCYRNEDGESYACIRYNVSERTQRIGYTLCRELDLPKVTDWNPDDPLEGFAHVDVEATADTWLTDDPDVSQYRQFRVPEGTLFSCMGLYNDYYAYVAAEVKGDGFTDGGAIVWGFVPIRDLKPMEQEKQAEAMDKLAGSWGIYAGGSMADDYLVFNRDGTFTAGTWNWDLDRPEEKENAAEASGTWVVTAYNPFMNLYWNKPAYQLILVYQDGRAVIRGLEFTEEGFSLTDAEGGGGYMPVLDDDAQPAGDHG